MSDLKELPNEDNCYTVYFCDSSKAREIELNILIQLIRTTQLKKNIQDVRKNNNKLNILVEIQ